MNDDLIEGLRNAKPRTVTHQTLMKMAADRLESYQPQPTLLTPESLARLFHEKYERLAPRFHYETRQASAVAWEDVPANNKALMIAVAAEIMTDLGATYE